MVPSPVSDPRLISGVRLKCLQNLVLMPIYCITARIIWLGYLKCAQSESWQHFTTTTSPLTLLLTLPVTSQPSQEASYLYHRVSVSYRGKSCPVNQIVIIAVFASSSSDCFNSLIISNDQSSSRPMNEILAWQHLFVTTLILSVCSGLRKYSNNTSLVVLQSLAKHSSSWSASSSHVIYLCQLLIIRDLTQ